MSDPAPTLADRLFTRFLVLAVRVIQWWKGV